MNIEKFTKKTIETVELAQKTAKEHGNQEIDQEHLVLALLDVDRSLITRLVSAMGKDAAGLRAATESAVDRKPKVSG